MAGSLAGRRLLLAGTRLIWAAALLRSPDRLIQAVGGSADDRSRRIAKILGARHAIQGAIELVSWPRWRRAGIAVDGLHAATAAGLGVLDRSRRLMAISDAGIATAFAVLGSRLNP